jgi:tetratricopeptide (TPR) repeat protein
MSLSPFVSLRPVRVLAVAAAAALAAPAAWAQKKPPMEFTRQGLLVLNFTVAPGVDVKVGRKAGDRVRDRAADLVNSREVDVVSATRARERLEHDGFPSDIGLEPAVFNQVSRALRADEYVMGSVSRRGDQYRLEADLRLVRSVGTRQPLETGTHADLDLAGDVVAKSLVAMRAQLVYERRCTNALREGRGAQALEAARQGIAVVPRGAFVRACEVGALITTGAPALRVLAAAESLLAIDSTSREGLDGAGRALNTLARRDAAATMWLRLAQTDSESTELTLRAAGGLLEGGNAKRALPLLARAVEMHPDELTLVRVQWQAAFAAKEWALAARIGDTLFVRDGTSEADSTFRLRHVAAHRAAGHTLRAVELAARGVTEFPSNAGLYVLYTELVQAERDSVVPRGLATFPKSAELHALAAKDLKTRGKAEEALAAMQQAVALDSTLPQGVLAIAQAEFDLGRPDSAFQSLARALKRGEDTSAVAQFALAKGNVLLRAAGQTQVRDDFARALRFFTLADSARPTPQSKFLLGTAALNVSKAALTEAPKLPDKPASCTLARLGGETLAAARTGLEAGQVVAPEVAKQYLDYVAQIAPFAEKQLAMYCDGAPATGVAPAPATTARDTIPTAAPGPNGATVKVP